MDPTRGPPAVVVSDDVLHRWQYVGSGGFGKIYKARHKDLGMDVAIKLLHHGNNSQTLLLREAELMRKADSPYVLRVMGVFQGCAPFSSSPQLGVVMEFMESGSLADLLDKLSHPPPWPLVFRTVHQIALGMNFLHHLPKPLLHLDLKPSNVLLDDSIKVKIADFGLAKVYHIVPNETNMSDLDEGGTITYMPPEAFESPYTPTKASDVYSYGILLWSIVTGREPYDNAQRSMVKFRIPQGDRPPLDMVKEEKVPGLEELKVLMAECWDKDPLKRPSFLECLEVTERLFKQHKKGVHTALSQLEEDLELPNKIKQGVAEPLKLPGSHQSSHHARTGPLPIQEIGGLTLNERNKQPYRDRHLRGPTESLPRAAPASLAANRQPSSKPRVANPVQETSSPLPSHLEKTGSKPVPPHLRTGQSYPQYERRNSSPVDTPRTDGSRRTINIQNSSLIQIGNGNIMNISQAPSSGVHRQKERRRNPTAPS